MKRYLHLCELRNGKVIIFLLESGGSKIESEWMMNHVDKDGSGEA